MKKMVIWPVNLAAGRTKREGRIVARRYAIKSPKVEEISSVAQELHLEPEVEKEKAYPKSPWDRSGRVLVLKRGSKGEIVRAIANRLRAQREKAKSGGR
ncbi:MAG TPA: signal recognition particle protein Srp19 [Methanomicrobia archaeon]|nr:signal recognition particle protein Srp19 [Methanomicrobia archaeon]